MTGFDCSRKLFSYSVENGLKPGSSSFYYKEITSISGFVGHMSPSQLLHSVSSEKAVIRPYENESTAVSMKLDTSGRFSVAQRLLFAKLWLRLGGFCG